MAHAGSTPIARFDFDVCVPAAHPSLPGHFPGNPIVPGVLLLDVIVVQLEQATGRRVVHLQQVKFTTVLRPDEHAVAECDVAADRATFRAFVRRDRAHVPLASGSVLLQAAPTA